MTIATVNQQASGLIREMRQFLDCSFPVLTEVQALLDGVKCVADKEGLSNILALSSMASRRLGEVMEEVDSLTAHSAFDVAGGSCG